MLIEILDGNIQIVEEVENWEKSIEIASKPLLEKGMIEKTYIEAMINSIKKIGFYVVLRENLAMPHARPEDGVIKTSLSLLKINNYVYYGERKVQIVIILAASDSNSHINIIMQLSELLQNEDDINKLVKSFTKKDILSVLEKY